MTRTSHRTVAMLLLAATSVLAACGVKSDDAPRDIPDAEQADLGSPADSGAGAAVGSSRIYLLGPSVVEGVTLLRPVARDAGTATERIEALLAGPNTSELGEQLRSAIPVGTRINGPATLGNATLRVDLSEEFLQLTGTDLVDALAQIVFTASTVDGVQLVRVTVDGADQQWPAGDGTLQSGPLDVYDYPNRVESGQPPYPAIPSGGPAEQAQQRTGSSG